MLELTSPRFRVPFLFVLALAISILFFEVIESFLTALVMASVLAGLAYPIYRRLVLKTGGRERLASATVVVMCLLLVVVPVSLFLGVLVNEAIEISDTAGDWVERQIHNPETLEERIEDIPALEKLLPYQDKILEKLGKLAGKMSGFVAKAMAAGAKGTAEYFLMIFIMLYAMFYFLLTGGKILENIFYFTPLLGSDRRHLFDIFVTVSRATLKGTFIIGIVQGDHPASIDEKLKAFLSPKERAAEKDKEKEKKAA